MGLCTGFWVSLCAVACCLACGCAKEPSFEYDGLDLAPSQEELSEFSLGEYSIPIPVAEEHRKSGFRRNNRFQLEFELHALIAPGRKSEIADNWSRNEGTIRDDVIRVCRNASIDALREPEFLTLKAQLMDALALRVGESGLRQLLITEVMSQRL
jgi:hypothetical protein